MSATRPKSKSCLASIICDRFSEGASFKTSLSEIWEIIGCGILRMVRKHLQWKALTLLLSDTLKHSLSSDAVTAV